ncbi:putative copper-transporting ATPase HMA5 [Hypsizygus marmoreus]|uniref:Copper-transporting ATPase HMA5 n=1 Tax=Hypsizygus marmoreus TaxID=39966 RepID=A0A369JVG6_HYPMA|nr:putative copper-transporting ATPase HMA5 [Hypsizygus marmoreus]
MQYFRMAPSTPLDERITVAHISNIHCDSCTKTIDQYLATLSPPPLSVVVSVVQQLVTVTHLKSLSPSSILNALLDAGFDVLRPTGSASSIPADSSSLVRHRKHLEHCIRCREEEAKPVNHTPIAGLLTSSVEEDPGPSTVTLSIGGMTCSSCTHAITEAASRIQGVSNVAVNLLAGSAQLVVQSRAIADVVCEAIIDSGYDAQVISINPIRRKEEIEETMRIVSLRIDGMFCPNCARKVMSAIESFGNRITVVKPLASYTDPILTLSYRPDPASLSIRMIMASIVAAGSPPFRVTVHHPPTLEQLSHAMQLREQRRILFQLLFSIVAAVPALIIGIVYMTLVKDGNPAKSYLMHPMWVGNVSRGEWALLFIATPVMFYSASLFHTRSFKELRALWRPGSSTPYLRRFIRFGSMNLLVSLGVSVAYFASIALLCLAARSPPQEMGDSTTYFDSVVFLTMFLLAGRFLEAYSKARTTDAVSALTSLRPTNALLLVPTTKTDRFSITLTNKDPEKGDITSEGDSLSIPLNSKVEKIPVDHLEVGDIVRVQSGATPPTDGTIMLGQHGIFDESSLTGEARLVKKQPGDKVFVGTINKAQVLHIRVDAIQGGTMLEKIVAVVREGQNRRAPIERVADHITGYFVPVITLLAVLTWIVWLLLGLTGSLPADYLDIDIGGWPVWSLQFAIAVFVVACPCGIGLAAPTALYVGSGLAAKCGILARGGGESFQEMAQLDLVVFDKTGTLTEGGEPRVADHYLLPSVLWTRETVLGIAAELESVSSHPLAVAIRSFCKDVDHQGGSSFEETPGRGVKAAFLSLHCTAIIGNEAWMQEHGAVIAAEASEHLEAWKSEGKSVVLLAIQDEQSGSFSVAASFSVADPLRPGAPGVISQLHSQGISTWMISGDNFTTASAVAAAVGIPPNNVIAGVLPHEKSREIQRLQREGPKRSARSRKWGQSLNTETRTIVAMVGDGINDAPALAVADVGIAIGSGSDIALSSASFVLLSSDLRSLITLRDLSQRIINRVKFNFVWAVMYNMIALPVAAGVLYPAGHVRLNPVWASLAMALSSVSVVCSSLLLKRYKEPRLSS